jgi:hypothetical protein
MVRAVLAGVVFTAAWVAPASGQTKATIYPDGRVFVRRTIPHPISAGSTVVPLPEDNALVGSVVALDSGVTVVSASLPQPGEPGAILRRSVGHRVVFRMTPTEDTVSALVVSADPARYLLPSGLVLQTLPAGAYYPQDALGPASAVTVRSTLARPHLSLGYMAQGAWWIAHYTLMLGERRGTLSGAAIVVSETISLDSAELSVLEGDVTRVIPPTGTRNPEERARAILMAAQPQVRPASSRPVRIHRIPGRFTLRPGYVESLPLVPSMDVPVERVVRVPGLLDNTMLIGSVSGGGNVLVPTVRYVIPRVPEARLAGGLPRGSARIYRRIGPDQVMVAEGELVADGDPDGPLELVAGASPDVYATRTLHLGVPVHDTVVSATGSRTVRAVATIFEHAVLLQNVSDTAQTVEIVERRRPGWSLLSSSVPGEPAGRGTVRFRIVLQPRETVTFTARMRVPVE